MKLRNRKRYSRVFIVPTTHHHHQTVSHVSRGLDKACYDNKCNNNNNGPPDNKSLKEEMIYSVIPLETLELIRSLPVAPSAPMPAIPPKKTEDGHKVLRFS